MALGARDEPSAGLGLHVARTAWPSWAWRAAPPCNLPAADPVRQACAGGTPAIPACPERRLACARPAIPLN